MKPSQQRDVIIIGAGPAGSSLAAALAKSGWDIVLVERHQFPRHKVCGEFLSPEAQTSLRSMGLYQVVKNLSPVVIEWAKLVSPAGLSLPVALPGQAWGVSRFALDATLARAAEQNSAEVLTGHTATAITQRNKGYEVALRSRGKSLVIEARAVIAACGRYSRPGLPPRSAPGQRQPDVGLKCHYEGVSMPDQVELFFFPGGYVGVNPVENGRVNVCLLVSQAVLARTGKNIRAVREEVSRRQPALARRLSEGRVVPETEVAVAPVDTIRPALPWDGMACLGDTAVMIPPLCGDGMAMALRSAEFCAPMVDDFLHGCLSLADWETAYRAAWHAEFDRPVKVARSLQLILSVPVLSDLCLGLGRLAPPLAASLVRATRATSL